MILTRGRSDPKTEVELFTDKLKQREIETGNKISYYMETSQSGKILNITTDDPDLITWLQNKGFS